MRIFSPGSSPSPTPFWLGDVSLFLHHREFQISELPVRQFHGRLFTRWNAAEQEDDSPIFPAFLFYFSRLSALYSLLICIVNVRVDSSQRFFLPMLQAANGVNERHIYLICHISNQVTTVDHSGKHPVYISLDDCSNLDWCWVLFTCSIFTQK